MPGTRCTAFAGSRLIASGELRHVALTAKQAHDAAPEEPVRVFDDRSGRLIPLPLAASDAELLRLLAAGTPAPAVTPAARRRGPGRPRLGVIAREVTLLPAHWDWLAAQPGGASLALRRLVDKARRSGGGDDPRHAAREAAYRFLRTMAAHAPGHEAAARALFAGDARGFEEALAGCPEDIAAHATMLAAGAFAD